MKRLPALVLCAVLLLSGCTSDSAGVRTPLPEIVGEWQAGNLIISAAPGMIDGQPYLFLMMMDGTETTAKAVLRVLDLRDPTEPIEIASLVTPTDMTLPLGGLILSGTNLYIALTNAEGASIWVVDVSEPSSPREVALTALGYAAWRPIVSGNILTVATALRENFTFLDISDPSQPEPLADLTLTERPLAVSNWQADFAGTIFYIIDRDGLTMVDISSPSSPQEVGFYANPDWVEQESVKASGEIQASTGKEIFNIHIPEGSFQDVTVSDGYAYISAADSGLLVLDVTDPASPEPVSQLELPDRSRHILVEGDLAYIMGVDFADDGSLSCMFGYNLHIVDISDPLVPKLVDSVERVFGALPPWQSVVALGEYVYFINMADIRVIDVYGSGND